MPMHNACSTRNRILTYAFASQDQLGTDKHVAMSRVRQKEWRSHRTIVDTPRCTDCSIHAHCAQSPTSGAFQCKCNAGFQGNGQLCYPQSRVPSFYFDSIFLASCLDDRSICDSHAECVPGEGGQYVCNCHYGYHGNGRTCARRTT